MDKALYLHRSCQPLVQIDFAAEIEKKDNGKKDPRLRQINLHFSRECQGVCRI
jgi:hypothetical protein